MYSMLANSSFLCNGLCGCTDSCGGGLGSKEGAEQRTKEAKACAAVECSALPPRTAGLTWLLCLRREWRRTTKSKKPETTQNVSAGINDRRRQKETWQTRGPRSRGHTRIEEELESKGDGEEGGLGKFLGAPVEIKRDGTPTRVCSLQSPLSLLLPSFLSFLLPSLLSPVPPSPWPCPPAPAPSSPPLLPWPQPPSSATRPSPPPSLPRPCLRTTL